MTIFWHNIWVSAGNNDLGCRDASHLWAINAYYESIMHALHSASHSAIPRIPYHSLKPFWNEELDRLKDDYFLAQYMG